MPSRLPSRRAVLLAVLALPSAAKAQGQAAAPAEVERELASPRPLGRGRMSFFGLQIYDARLWVGSDFVAQRYEVHPLALELEYARTLYGAQIAERSLDEMKRGGPVSDEQAERWLAAMNRSFPDVHKGDRITGVQRPGESARFFVNGGLRGELRDAEFARRFFGIWLAPQTSEPALRRALLGLDGARS